MQTQEKLPNVREYLDYRSYLKDFLAAKKKISGHYSYRVFSRIAQINSPSHLKMIIDGKRNLTHSTKNKYIKALGLTSKKDIKYFDLLVRYDQEKKAEKKIQIFQDLLNEKNKKSFSLLAKEQYKFLSQWHYVAIYVLVDLDDFKNETKWIMSKLIKKVTETNIEKAINDLIKIGLLEYDVQRGLRQSQGALDTPEEIQSMAVIPYHRSMINLALNYLELGDCSRREFNGGTIPMNKETLVQLKEKIREFRKDVNDMTAQLDSTSDVYQLNLQLFPLTEGQI